MNPAEEKNTLEFELSGEDLKRIEEIAAEIDLDSAAGILQYGTSCQQKIDTFSDSVLENARKKDMGKISGLIAELAEELRGVSSGGRRKRIKMEKLEDNVDTMTAMLYDHQNRLLEETIRLKKFYQENLSYYRELTIYIEAGKRKLEITAGGAMRENFEKKIHDLEVTRLICVQMAAQLDIIRNNNVAVSDKIQAVLKNAIPLWKNRMTTAMSIEDAAESNGQLISALDEMVRAQNEGSE
ncbi:MAG: toxic anion resistance protein [Firmicutes bacterium]|nr:toxic anion resistance protein [Bacillota bacterium]